MQRNNIYFMSANVKSRLEGEGKDYCAKCKRIIVIGDKVLSKVSGCNQNRHARVYHIECAKELRII